MRVDGNGGQNPNYFPNSFDDIEVDQGYKEPPLAVHSHIADWYDRNCEGENDHYSQPGKLFQIMTPEQQQNTINNIVGAMSGIEGPKRLEIINRQLCHWYRADGNLGMGISKGLGVEVDMTKCVG